MQFDELLTALPVPTPEQTGRFADHVADNHSWYKHLPFFPPGASFVFFPNPHAGRCVTAEGERFVIRDVEQGNYFAHHSGLPTTEYQDLFGHWDYWVDDNPRHLDPQPGPWLHFPDEGRRELLADDLRRQWSCRLTAFIRPAPPMFELRAAELEREADVFLASGRGLLDRVLRGVQLRKRVEDPAVGRYRRVAEALRGGAWAWGDLELFRFMESEAGVQRRLLLDTLHRLRAEWSEFHRGHA